MQWERCQFMKVIVKNILLLIVLIHINQLYGMENKSIEGLVDGEKISKMLSVNTQHGPIVISGTNKGNIIICYGENTDLLYKRAVSSDPITVLVTQDLSSFKLAIFAGTRRKLHRLC